MVQAKAQLILDENSTLFDDVRLWQNRFGGRLPEILELKLWYGDKRHEEAYEQIAGYLKSKNMDCGYLITYDFRKRKDVRFHEAKWVEWEGKQIFDVVLNVGEEV